MAQKRPYQHEPLRVPPNWRDQDRALVLQIDRLFDELYNKLSELKDLRDSIDSDEAQIATVSDQITTIKSERLYGRRITKAIPANTNTCVIDFPGGVFLVNLSMPGLSRTWFGLVYVSNAGAVTVEQINTQTGITVTTGTNMITADFTYTSDTNFHMVAIPMRSNTFPSFH